MAMSYTIYAFGNVAELQSMFNGVAMVMNGGEYGTLLHTLSIFCLMMFTTAGIVKAMNLEPVTHLLGVGFFYLTLFVPKADVVIVDTMGTGPVTVSNVPLGIAMMNAMTSQMGYWLTTRYETSFGVVDDLQYQKNGLLFGANIYKNINSARPMDPILYSNLTNFFKECVMPELGSDPTKQSAINTSDDTWNLVSGTWTNPAYILTVYSATSSSTMTCPDAWSAIDAQFKANLPVFMSQLGSVINANKVTTLSPSDLLASQVSSTMNSIIVSSKTAQDYLMQAMSVNLLKDQFMSNQSAWAVAQAAAQYSAGAVTSGYLVNESLPLMRNVIESILIAMTPVVILMCVVAGMPRGLGVLKHYFAGCIWVQLWAPLYAVVNNLAWQHTGKGIAAAMAGYQGITLQNQAMGLSTVLSSEATVANLVYLIPVVALIVAYAGVQSAAAVASGLMQSQISSGSSVGGQIASGNNNVGGNQWGNTSVGNYQNGNFSKGGYSLGGSSEGQFNNQPSLNEGAAVKKNTDSSGMQVATFSGYGAGSGGGYGQGGTLNATGANSDLGAYTPTLNAQAQTTAQRLSDNSYTAASSQSAASINSLSAGLNKLLGHTDRSGNGTNISTNSSLGSDASTSDAIARMSAVRDGVAKRLGVSDDVANQIVAAAGAGFSVGGIGPASLKASLETRGVRGSTLSSAMNMAQELSNDNSFKNDMSTVRKFGESLDTSTTGSKGSETARSIGADFKNAKTSQTQASQSLDKAETYKLAAGSSETGTSGIQYNPSQAWVNSKGGPEGARNFLQSHSPAQIMSDMNDFMKSDAGLQSIKQAMPSFHDNSGMNRPVKAGADSLAPVPTSASELKQNQSSNDRGVINQDAANRGAIPGSATAAPVVTTTSTNQTTGQPITQTVSPQNVVEGVRAAQGVVGGKVAAGGAQLDSEHNSQKESVSGKLDHLSNDVGAVSARNNRNTFFPGNTQDDVLQEIKGKK